MKTIAVIFGSQSVEHDVSIVTGRLALESLDQQKYRPLPIYIARDGVWYANFNEGARARDFKGTPEQLKLWKTVSLIRTNKGSKLVMGSGESWVDAPLQPEVVVVAVHGTAGEDGTLQGLLELVGLPYTGSDVLGSALGMNKVAMKELLRHHGLPIADYLSFARADWQRDPEEIEKRVKKQLSYPVFVKPANLGSSIGVSKVNTPDGLKFAIDVAASYDNTVIVEEGIEDMTEINVAVFGGDRELTASLCEQPLRAKDFLDFEEKYISGGGSIKQGAGTKGTKGSKTKVLIPAPLPESLAHDLREAAKKVFSVLRSDYGMARIDFMTKPKKKKFWVTEINTVPGTLQLGLWQASGVPMPQLLDKLISLAEQRFQEKQKNNRVFESSLLK